MVVVVCSVLFDVLFDVRFCAHRQAARVTPLAVWVGVVFGMLLGTLPCSRTVLAQGTADQVRLTPPLKVASDEQSVSNNWYPDALTTLAGTVQTFDSKQLSIVISGSTAGGSAVPQRYAAERVLEIKLGSVPDDQKAAIDAFNKGRFTDAVKGFVASVSKTVASERPPVWRQQWLSMMAAQAAYRSGRGEIALEIVQQLDARPLPPMTLGILPIDWTGRTITNQVAQTSLIAVAVKRAASDSMAVKLVAASWLLHSPKYRDAASAALDRIASQTERKWIASLAGQLRWRTKLPPEIQSKWRDWEKEIQLMPMALQTGPLFSLTHHVETAGLEDATRKLKLALEFAAPAWHPDLLN